MLQKWYFPQDYVYDTWILLVITFLTIAALHFKQGKKEDNPLSPLDSSIQWIVNLSIHASSSTLCYVVCPQWKCTCKESMTVCYKLSTIEYWNNAPMSLHCIYASKILKHPQYISKSPLWNALQVFYVR